MFQEIYTAGVDFAENKMSSWAQRFIPAKRMSDDDKKYFSGAAALSVGNLVENLGYVGALVSVTLAAVAVFNPVSATAIALAGIMAGGAVSGAAICFGSGMEEGGDRNCGLKNLRKAVQSGLWQGFRDDVRKWINPKSARVDFDAVNKKDAAKKLVAAPAPAPKPQQQPRQ